VWLAAVVQW